MLTSHIGRKVLFISKVTLMVMLGAAILVPSVLANVSDSVAHNGLFRRLIPSKDILVYHLSLAL